MKTKNIISAYSYVIHPEGESTFSEQSYTVSREDEGAGEYITITDGMGNKIKIESDDVDDIFSAIKRLIEQMPPS